MLNLPNNLGNAEIRIIVAFNINRASNSATVANSHEEMKITKDPTQNNHNASSLFNPGKSPLRKEPPSH